MAGGHEHLIRAGAGGDLCIQKNSKMVCIGLSLGSYGGGTVSALGNLTMHLDGG